jgi:hypothetical protein
MKAKTIASATIPAVAPDVQPITSNTSGTSKPLNEKLKELVNQSPIMLFMKGNANNPQCGKFAITCYKLSKIIFPLNYQDSAAKLWLY